MVLMELDGGIKASYLQCHFIRIISVTTRLSERKAGWKTPN